jgi:thymidylate synthase (FAD)
MARIVVPEAEAILNKEFKLLDHGFVRLVDCLGGDARIVAAARVSYGPGTKSVREQVILTFHAKLPLFVARQWVRHRTARLNEISGRYSVMADEFYLPAGDQIRKQNKRNKQGRAPEDLPQEPQERALAILKREQTSAYASYEELLRDDIARELARINLPLTLYTQWYWQIDPHHLFHFLRLRLDKHAQYEIRQYAE